MGEAHLVYILRCKDDTLYTGYTNDLPHRLKMHECGKGAKYTRGRGPFEVAYTEGFPTKEEAMRREYQIKQLSRPDKEKLIESKGKEVLADMMIQKSFENETEGAIFLVPTPIGNLEDITYRALNTLKTATVIAAEDTRNTKKLLNYFEINTPLTSYHEHSHQGKITDLIRQAEEGAKIAVVSDAGMPAISDPGSDLVEEALKRNVKVIVLPGANAALAALVGSGLSTNEFYFYGFLPRKKKEKIEILTNLKKISATLIFYESPFRVKDTLEVLRETLGNRNITLARELTKRFEEYVRGTADELSVWVKENELKGEFVLVVEGASAREEDVESEWWTGLDVKGHVDHYIDTEGLSSKDAIKQVAIDRGVPKRTVYQTYHIE